MYLNFYKEMKARNLNQALVADKIGITRESLNNKLNGKTDFKAKELFDIKQIFFPDLTLEYLFAKE